MLDMLSTSTKLTIVKAQHKDQLLGLLLGQYCRNMKICGMVGFSLIERFLGRWSHKARNLVKLTILKGLDDILLNKIENEPKRQKRRSATTAEIIVWLLSVRQ